MRNGNGNFLLSLILVFVFTITSSMSVLGQSQAVKTEDLIKRSDLIVVGKVGRMASEWTEDKSRIQTRVTISVDQTIKGGAPGNSITVLIPGGEVDGVGEWYSHTPRFVSNEDVVIFAERDNKGRLRVSYGDQGKISIQREKTTGALVVPSFGPLEQFTMQIRTAVEAQERGILQQK